jgi:hypothetical protein
MQKKPMTRDEISSLASNAIQQAVDYIESDLAEDWLKAERYFKGEVDIGHEQGRSKVVATKCRDTVRAVKPPLVRAFLATDKPVEFIATTPDDVEAAEQATAYVRWKFGQQNGFSIIGDVIQDALVKKAGIAKVWHEESDETEIDEYTGLTDDQFAIVAADDEVEVLEHSAYPEQIEDPNTGQMIEAQLHDAKISKATTRGEIKMRSVSPENFFVSADATDVDDAFVIGDRNDTMRVGDLVDMGYSFDEVVKYAGSVDDAIQSDDDADREAYNTENAGDESSRLVLVTEAYIPVDIERVGSPQLYRFLCVGSGYHVLDYDLADDKPYAVFQVDPEPHQFFGRSLVEVILHDQDAATAMLRGLLDNTALSNSPPVDVVEDAVDMESVLNNEIGAIRKVQSLDAIRWNPVPFAAGQTLPAMEFFNEQIKAKTGVSDMASGLDADVLQNQTATAVNAMQQAATGQVELMARNLAEGGMRRLFRLMAKLVRQHADGEVMMRINGAYAPVDPRSWNTSIDVIANVGIGTGGEVEREMILREVLQHQMQIWQGYGPQNGLVSMTQIRNTLADIMAMGGLQNADRYFNPMDPQTERMLLQQAAQAAQQQGQGSDPNAAFLQAEGMKAQAKQQTDMARLQLDAQKAMAEEQRKRQEMAMDDDLDRDKMIQDLAVKVAEILGEYGTRVDTEAIRARQQANNGGL